MLEFELSILDFIQSFTGNGLIDNFWVFMTHLGDNGIVWILLSVALLINPKTRKIGVMCTVALALSGLLTNGVLKHLVKRARPFNYSDIELLIKEPRDYSFPSGHTSISFAVAFVLLKEKFKINTLKMYIPIMVLAFLVSFSRLYLYVHFPSDIIAAIVLAYGYSFIARKVGNKLIH
ncbi:MAG: phosphatase PAP2 family protein [Clostridiales bacterium]|nr:phosphatase PAP2 family protein [Clostridiales bacterium]